MEKELKIEDDFHSISAEEFGIFLSSSSKKQWEILLNHAEQNKKIIKLKEKKEMGIEQNNYEEINKQFQEFCHTKGIVAKFKLAFANMKENVRKQKETDKKSFEEIKRQSTENNAEFTEFLHTKGVKSKVKLVIENVKQGAKESNEKVRQQIKSAKHRNPITADYSASDLSREFNAFLKAKGLDRKYVVEVLEENNV